MPSFCIKSDGINGTGCKQCRHFDGIVVNGMERGVVMKKLTIRMEDEGYERLKKYAEEHGESKGNRTAIHGNLRSLSNQRSSTNFVIPSTFSPFLR